MTFTLFPYLRSFSSYLGLFDMYVIGKSRISSKYIFRENVDIWIVFRCTVHFSSKTIFIDIILTSYMHCSLHEITFSLSYI